MPEIGTSGSMSGDGKRSVAEWPKLSRPSSTLPKLPSGNVRYSVAIEQDDWRFKLCLPLNDRVRALC